MSPLCPPSPGKAIKLYFSVSPRSLSLRFDCTPVYREAELSTTNQGPDAGVVVVQWLSLCLALCDPMDCSTPASLSFTISQSLLKLMSIESMMPSNHLILCHSLLLLSIFLCIRIFTVSWLFTSGGQSIGASASALVLPMNIQDSFPFRWTGWISLLSKELSRVFSNTSLKASIVWFSAFFMVQLS